MSTQPAVTGLLSPLEQLRYAREIILTESQALDQLARRIDAEFCRAIDLLFCCQGSVIVSGMGKAGLIGQKIAATLASTGTRSHFLHPGEAVHGDLGRIHRDDVVMILSQSGNTEEVTRLLPSLAQQQIKVIAVTGRTDSQLADAADVTIHLGPLQEACSLGLAPSTSTTAMLAVGDAMALVTSRMRQFRAEDFARFHPGGSLGHQLMKVEDGMRPIEECRVASDHQTVREIIADPGPNRRSGAVMLVGADGRLSGLFTDSDFRRLFEERQENALDGPICGVMTTTPITVPVGSMLTDAEAILAERKISELPVVNHASEPVGMVDITDAPRAASPQSEHSEKRIGPPRPKHLDLREPIRRVDS